MIFFFGAASCTRPPLHSNQCGASISHWVYVCWRMLYYTYAVVCCTYVGGWYTYADVCPATSLAYAIRMLAYAMLTSADAIRMLHVC